MDAKNYPSTIFATVALITSFGANNGSTGNGNGGKKNTDKLDAIVSLHLTDDSNNNSDDDDGPIESFESDDLNDRRANSNNESNKDKSTPTSEKEDDITGSSIVTTDDEDVNNHGSDGPTDDSSDDDASNSNGKSYISTTKTGDNTPSWMALVAMANKNVENGINSDIIDGTHDNQTNFQCDYDLDAEGIFDGVHK